MSSPFNKQKREFTMKNLLTVLMAVVLAPCFANADDAAAKDSNASAPTTEEAKTDAKKDEAAK